MNPDLEPGRLEVARQRDLEVGDQLDAADLHLELNGEMPYDDPYAKTYANKKSSTRKLKDKPPAKKKTETKRRKRSGRATLPLEDASDAVAAQIVAAARARAVSTPVVRSDSLTSTRSPLAWFERTNIGERNVIMPGPPAAPDFELTSLYAATLPEQRFTALVHSNGPDGPLVVYPPGAPPGALVQKPTRWVSTNARKSPIRNKATLLDFVVWVLRLLKHPNPNTPPRQLKPQEVINGFYEMPPLLFAPGSIHREKFLRHGFDAVVISHDMRAGRLLPPTVNTIAQAAGPAPLLLEAESEEEPRPVSVGGDGGARVVLSTSVALTLCSGTASNPVVHSLPVEAFVRKAAAVEKRGPTAIDAMLEVFTIVGAVRNDTVWEVSQSGLDALRVALARSTVGDDCRSKVLESFDIPRALVKTRGLVEGAEVSSAKMAFNQALLGTESEVTRAAAAHREICPFLGAAMGE